MKTEPNIFDPAYLLNELGDLLRNHPDSAPRLMENLLNIDYDFTAKDATYRVLTAEQRAWLHRIHLERKRDPDFNLQFQEVLFTVSGAVGLGFVLGKLLE